MSRELQSIIGALKSSEIIHDKKSVKDSIGRLVNISNGGCDINEALPFVIKLLPLNDIVLKKLCLLLLIKSCNKEMDLILLTRNTLQQEFRDPNPLVRSLTLKTICCLRDEACGSILHLGLKDDNALVCRTAVLNCMRVNKIQDRSWEAETIEHLYKLLREEDPLVVTNSLAILDEILQSEQGVALNRNIVNHLLNQIYRFSSWGQVQVLVVLKKYQTKSEQELFDFLNVLDSLFQSCNCSVVLATYDLFKHFLLTVNSQLITSAFKRVCINLRKFLNLENPELVCLILDFLKNELENRFEEIECLLPSLLCNYEEPTDIKIKKIEILSKIGTKKKFVEIFEDISVYLTDSDKELSKAAINALGEMAKDLEAEYFQLLISKLFMLLNLSDGEVLGNLFWVLQQLNLRCLEDIASNIQHLTFAKYELLLNCESKSAFLWLLGEYGDLIPESPYVLEEISENCTSISLNEGLSMLICALKLFFKRPAECQPILGRILELCFNQNCPDLQNEVIYYYNLLKNNAGLCKEIVN